MNETYDTNKTGGNRIMRIKRIDNDYSGSDYSVHGSIHTGVSPPPEYNSCNFEHGRNDGDLTSWK